MCHHGVTGAYITSLSRVGYSGLPAADYIRLHDHGVTAESIERLSRAHPGTKLSVDDLIRLQPRTKTALPSTAAGGAIRDSVSIPIVSGSRQIRSSKRCSNMARSEADPKRARL